MTENTAKQSVFFTNHALERMTERKIPASYVRRVFAYGTPTWDLDDNVDKWTVDLGRVPDADWARRLAGIVVVASGLTVITTYFKKSVRSEQLELVEMGV